MRSDIKKTQVIDPAERFLKRVENHIKRMAVEFRKTGSANYESHMRLIMENLNRLSGMTMEPQRKQHLMQRGWALYEKAQNCNYPERLEQLKIERAQWLTDRILGGGSQFQELISNKRGTISRYWKAENVVSSEPSLVGKLNIPFNPPHNNEIWQKGYGYLLGADPNGGWKVVSTAKAEVALFDKSCAISKTPSERNMNRDTKGK